MSHLEKYEKFLASVNLDKYRHKYQPIKIVEMDMPKDIQALDIIYKIYWEEKRFILFEPFFKNYLAEYTDNLEVFRKKTQMCKTCFYLGLPARIYRTWASIITQIQAGYLAESIFGKGTVSMNSELDRKGADFQLNFKSKILNFQVKKESQSREVRKEKVSKNTIEGKFINLVYNVPTREVFENPKKRDGEFRKPYLDFLKNKTLKRLSNGFIVFTPEVFIHNPDCKKLLLKTNTYNMYLLHIFETK